MPLTTSPAGIVSCIAFSPAGDLFAAGTYTGALGVYDARTYELLLILTGNRGGLTQVGAWTAVHTYSHHSTSGAPHHQARHPHTTIQPTAPSVRARSAHSRTAWWTGL